MSELTGEIQTIPVLPTCFFLEYHQHYDKQNPYQCLITFNFKQFSHSITKYGDIINDWNVEKNLQGVYREKGDIMNKFTDFIHVLFINCNKMYIE